MMEAFNDVPVAKSQQDLKLNKTLNMIVPGSGTMRAALQEEQHFIRSSQLWTGLLQLVTAPTGIGYYWSYKHNQKLEENVNQNENLNDTD